jgi:predicted amidohydrolase YtcJ
MGKITRGEFLGRSATLAAALGLGSLPGCTRDDTVPGDGAGSGAAPDLVVTNANVITVDDAQPRAQALAVKGGRFIAVGSDEDVSNLIGRGTQVIDAEGMTVVPGFIDTHTHPASGGIRAIINVDVDLRSIGEIQDALRRRAAETPPNQWVTGYKYDDMKVAEGRRINRHDLDEAVPNHPVRVSPRGGHATFYNTKALELAGITREVSDPFGGRFFRDQNGDLTGMVAAAANRAFDGIAPDETSTREQRQAGVKLILDRKAATGLTTAHDAGAGQEALIAYQDAYAAGELTIRVYSLFSRNLLEGFKASGIRSGFGDEWLRIGPVKFASDGAVQTRTMYMSEPYVGQPDYHGVEYMTQEEIHEVVEDAHRNGFRIGIHANGDIPIARVLNAYERVQREWPRGDVRHRIEHCSLVNPQLVSRIAELGVVPTPFATYLYYHGDKWHEYGEERMRWMFAHRSFLDAGVPVPSSSDYVPGPFEPLMAIQSMVTRKDWQGKTWGENQKVTVEEAIRIATLNGAYASFEENVKGSITAGKLGDFVILADDPHRVDPDRILDIPVVRTVIGGRTVHSLT